VQGVRRSLSPASGAREVAEDSASFTSGQALGIPAGVGIRLGGWKPPPRLGETPCLLADTKKPVPSGQHGGRDGLGRISMARGSVRPAGDHLDVLGLAGFPDAADGAEVLLFDGVNRAITRQASPAAGVGVNGLGAALWGIAGDDLGAADGLAGFGGHVDGLATIGSTADQQGTGSSDKCKGE
jgi:hypothetical protein